VAAAAAGKAEELAALAGCGNGARRAAVIRKVKAKKYRWQLLILLSLPFSTREKIPQSGRARECFRWREEPHPSGV
jgi:hypothetical protein